MAGFRGPIPARLDWLKASEHGRAWLDALPGAVEESAGHWGLRLDEPFPYAFTSLAIPGRMEDGTDVVLKVQYLDRETEHEALALRLWNGNDLHCGNVLAAQREPWLVIDPKPLVGEREFGLAPIIRSQELGSGRREVQRRLDRLTSELGLDRERARQWCIAQTVAWSVGEGDIRDHVQVVESLLEGPG